MKFKVIGYPIGHSMSPFIHKELFFLKNIEADYSKLEIEPEKLGGCLEELKKLDGFNVTIPHKVKIMSLLDEIDVASEEYGAVNTVLQRNGRLYGYNTDAYGFLKGLEFSGIKLSGRVAVYGYGGAARTIITECLKADCEVSVITTENRLDKARATVSQIEKKLSKDIAVITDEMLGGNYSLFINASPIGMYPNVEKSPLDADRTDMFDAIYDIVYNPFETELLRSARALGKKCGGGLSMLVFQAVKAHNIWYGAEFSNMEIEEIILKTQRKIQEDFKL